MQNNTLKIQAFLMAIVNWALFLILGLVLMGMVANYAEKNYIIGTADGGWAVVQGLMGVACSFFPLSFVIAQRAYLHTISRGSWKAAVGPLLKNYLLWGSISLILVTCAIFGLGGAIPRDNLTPFVFPTPTP